MFKVVIWATDGSREAEHALRYAKDLANAEGARLIVVHVDELALAEAGVTRPLSMRPIVQARNP